MRVELPKLLSVLSHELRSPLGVLQGYIRLLQRQRKDDDPEHVMLKAMLDATGRMTAITRQASELGAWLRATGESAAEPLAVETLARRVRDCVSGRQIDVEVDAPVATASLAARDPNMLAGALAAIAESLARDFGDVPVRISMGDDGGSVLCTIGPRPGTEPTPGVPVPTGPVAFDRGGLGLGLVLASYVLEGHAADVTRVQPSGMIEVRLQKNRGLA